jgi:hypothetical protein
MGHSDPIETVTFKHQEGNEGEKIGVKRGIAAFYGGKLLKRQGRGERTNTAESGTSLRAGCRDARVSFQCIALAMPQVLGNRMLL